MHTAFSLVSYCYTAFSLAAEHLPLPGHGPPGGVGDDDADEGPGGDRHTIP